MTATVRAVNQWRRLRDELGSRSMVMGVINVTPDSFSGDGLGMDVQAALDQARAMVEAGADVLDVGGESTRPGHEPVAAEDELRRAVPVVERLASEVDVPISIDTRKALVAEAALASGACIVNDVSGLRHDENLARVAGNAGCGLILQHWHPRSREDTVDWVVEDLRWSVQRAREAGVEPEDIIIDPGLGFGKSADESMELVRRLRELKASLLHPVLIGPSRKRFVGEALGGLPHDQRTEGTIGAAIVAVMHGADMVRVHDVLPTVRALKVVDAIMASGRYSQSPV
jgi:dihydropteroate synthase